MRDLAFRGYDASANSRSYANNRIGSRAVSFVTLILMVSVLLLSPLLSSVAAAAPMHADMSVEVQGMNMQDSANMMMLMDDHMSGMSSLDCLYGDEEGCPSGGCPEIMQSMCADHCVSIGGGLVAFFDSSSVPTLKYYLSNHQIALSEHHLLNVFLEHSTPPPKQA